MSKDDAGVGSVEYSAARQSWSEAGLSPLWESAVAHRPDAEKFAARHWRWSDLQKPINEAMTLVSPENVERRVLLFADPTLSTPGRPTSSRTMNAGLQILMPGEMARPHRHSLDAIRLVLTGEGARTIVNGRECPMAPGDLILTPGGAWHEHVHGGSDPIVWLDGLNGPLHRFLGTAVFEPGPVTGVLPELSANPHVDASLAPDVSQDEGLPSALYRYTFAQVCAALDAAPVQDGGFRRVRYVNPATGQNAIPLMDLSVMQIDAGVRTTPFKTNASMVCVALEGSGRTVFGEQILDWRPKDIFILPQNAWTSHESVGGKARLFVLSDREIFRRLGLLAENFGNQSHKK